MTSKEGSPSSNWLRPLLGYLRTPRARAKVRHWFRLQDREGQIQAGRTALEQEFQRLAIRIKKVDLNKLATQFNLKRADDLFAAIANGDLSTTSIAATLQDTALDSNQRKFPALTRKPRNRDKESGINIRGVGNLLVQIAGCCKPVPPESIVGYITQCRGVTIHRSDCPNLLNLGSFHQERFIEVSWGEDEDHAYPVDVQIEAYDRPGLLRDITSVLTNEKINVLSVNTKSDKNTATAHMLLTVEVNDVTQLSRVLDKITQLPNIESIRRRS